MVAVTFREIIEGFIVATLFFAGFVLLLWLAHAIGYWLTGVPG